MKTAQEFHLACACSLRPLREESLWVIRAAANATTDWDRFLRVVTRHRIEGQVHEALRLADVHIPSHIAQLLAHQAHEITRRNVVLAAEMVKLQRKFDSSNIPVLFVKGVALAILAYGSISFKHGKDIDLLVPPDRASAALLMLEQEGYRLWLPREILNATQRHAMFRYSKEAALIHSQTGVQVELHWALADNPLLLRGVDAFSPTQEVRLSAGQSVRTLVDEDLFAYLCTHGAIHAWSRLKWLADLHAFIARKTDADIERLYRLAQAKGAGLCAGQALLLCEKLFGLRAPTNLVNELYRIKRLRLLLTFAMDAMVGCDGETEVWDRRFGGTRIVLTHFLLGRGWRYLRAQCRTVSVALWDVLDYPLPPYLHFAYPLLRVPLWFWRLVLYRGHSAPLPPVPRRM